MLLVLCLMMGVGWAQPSPTSDATARDATARELYRLGASLYESGRYDEALVAFREAYDASGRMAILYNMANTQERLGDLEGAIDSLRRYVRFAPPARIPSIELRIAALRERLETVSPATAIALRPEPPPEPLVRRRARPRWGLVGVGGTLAAGFGTVAAYSYLEGLEDRSQLDEEGFQRNLLLNRIAFSAAGVGGGLVVLGFIVPKKVEVLVSAAPSGASTLRR